MTEVTWSPESLRDLESIRDYIARDSPLYADLVVRRIVAVVERLETFMRRATCSPRHKNGHPYDAAASAQAGSPARVNVRVRLQSAKTTPAQNADPIELLRTDETNR